MDSWCGETDRASAKNPMTEKAVNRTADAARKVYSVGIYARLSVDGQEEKNGSIENQIAIAKAYLEGQPDMVLYGCYTDLGKTGTNFDREGFRQLMAHVRMRKVDCIIVKDFSRFGRNYIEMGNYIQKIFPFLGVRFISVTDGFDSACEDNDDLSMNLKNLANELYARDIAVKVKSARKAQWENGSYTGGIPPYGYRIQWCSGVRRLLIEEGTAEIVREIFRLCAEGKTWREIAAWLYERKIHRPKEYRHYGHVFQEEGEALRSWPEGTLRLILANPVYIGCLVQARTCGSGVSSGDRSVREGAQEAIISEELFFLVADRFQKQKKYSNRAGYSRRVPEEADIFQGILFCGQCGNRMGRYSHVKELGSGQKMRLYGYFCRQSSRMDGQPCERKSIGCQKLTELVKTALRQEVSISGLKAGNLAGYFDAAAAERRRGLEKERRAAEKAMEDGRRRGSDLYLKYRSREIDRAAFLDWQNQEERRNEKRKARQEEIGRRLEEMDAETARQKRAFRAMLKFDETAALDRELLAGLVEKIEVWPDRRIEVTFRFRSRIWACAGTE